MMKRTPEGQKEILNPEAWERSLLHGLACEWAKALWVLSSAHRRRMRPPLFILRDRQDRWGSWSKEKREISLSRDLVLNHSWDAVCEVLLHEMAHQFTDEVFAVVHEPPHGPQFHQACFLLRANPKASGSYRTLDERMSQESSSPQNKMMDRVKKLMALAASSNHHEADSAMAKAYDLIAKYNLNLLSQNADRNFASVFVGQPALRHPPEDYSLAHLLQDFYFVQGIWVSTYVPEKGKMGRVLEVSGTIQNIKLASYVHDFVRRFIHSQWAEYNNGKRLNRYRQTDFAVGIIEGFRAKLERQSKEKGKKEDSLSLMKMEDPLLRKYIAYKYPHTIKVKRGIASQDKNVLKDGRRVGERLIIAKGIVNPGGSRGSGMRLLACFMDGLSIPWAFPGAAWTKTTDIPSSGNRVWQPGSRLSEYPRPRVQGLSLGF